MLDLIYGWVYHNVLLSLSIAIREENIQIWYSQTWIANHLGVNSFWNKSAPHKLSTVGCTKTDQDLNLCVYELQTGISDKIRMAWSVPGESERRASPFNQHCLGKIWQERIRWDPLFWNIGILLMNTHHSIGKSQIFAEISMSVYDFVCNAHVTSSVFRKTH